MQERRVYSLDIARGGLKLHESKAVNTENIVMMKDNIQASSVDMTTFAEKPGLQLDRQVVNAMGLTASYELSLHYGSKDDDVAEHARLFTALQDQLGLKLVEHKAPVEVLIVDHIEN